jgi:Protein of unknown function (DUF3303)
MLFIATYRGKPDTPKLDVQDKARKWWNEGECPKGLKLVACFRPLSAEEPGVMVFEAESADDVAKLITYWREWAFDVRPALDEMAAWRGQGMKV